VTFHHGFEVPGDLQLTADGKDIVLVSGATKVRQSIRVRFATFKGQWRYDRNVGVPYFEDILVAGNNVELVRRRFYDLLIGTDGVTSVQSLTVTFDSSSATVYVRFSVLTAAGQTVTDVLDFVPSSSGG
jgi:hypothetical protein